ncbi:MAG: hypothetical protein ACMUIU_05085 [bacterium]
MINKRKLKRCNRCGLPETYPGIQFNQDYICNYCVHYDLFKEREEIVKTEVKERIIKLIENIKEQRQKYHCIVAYSGGKDSSFLLYHLRTKYKLNILACTLDNGFLSHTALQNVKTITKALNIDSRIIKPDFELLKEVFTYALTERIPYPKEILSMVSQVCAVCIGMILGTTLNLAIDLEVPLLFFGFTPGQYPAISLENFLKVDSCLFFSDKVYRDDPLDVLKVLSDPIKEKFGKKVGKFFFKSQYIPSGLPVPKILFPFHSLLDYDETEILKEISKLGWIRPIDTDACSTNCLLNSVGNYACMKQLGYHPYNGELSFMVRKGKITRKDAIESEKLEANSYAITNSLEKLGLKISKI